MQHFSKYFTGFLLLWGNQLNKMKENKGFGIYLDRTLKKIASAYQKIFRDNDIELTIEQWVILQRIHDLKEKASQAEIAKVSYRNRATTSRVIGGLEKKGLIVKERFNGDLKRYKLVITSKGASVYEKILPLVKELRAIGYRNIDSDKFTVFLEVLEQIWENYDEVKPS